MDTKAKAEREVEDFNGMLKQVKAEREVEDFNGMLKQIEADIKALLVKKMAIKGVQRESMEARKEIIEAYTFNRPSAVVNKTSTSAKSVCRVGVINWSDRTVN
jgi:hypothetical protein